MAVIHTPKYATGGIVSISFAPVGILSGSTSWSEEFYTTKDSITFSQPEPSKSNILVDQLDVAVYTNYDSEALVLSGNIPDISKEVLEYLYEATAVNPYAPGDVVGTPSTTHTARGLKLGVNPIECMCKVTFGSTVSVIIANGTLMANWDGSNLSTTALGHNFSVTAKNGLGGTAGETADVVMWIPN